MMDAWTAGGEMILLHRTTCGKRNLARSGTSLTPGGEWCKRSLSPDYSRSEGCLSRRKGSFKYSYSTILLLNSSLSTTPPLTGLISFVTCVCFQDEVGQGELVTTLIELAQVSLGADPHARGSLSLSPTAGDFALAEKSLTVVQTCLTRTT